MDDPESKTPQKGEIVFKNKLDKMIEACDAVANSGALAKDDPRRGVAIKRRTVIGAGLAALGLLAMPNIAYADWNCGFWTLAKVTNRGYIGDDFGNVYNDYQDIYWGSNPHCETGWMEIQLNNYSNSPQFIAVSIVPNLVGDFTTELYHWMLAKSFAAWTSYNALTKRDCWTADGNDHYQSFPWWLDGEYKGDMQSLDCDLWPCANRDWSQDYRWTQPYTNLQESYHSLRRTEKCSLLEFRGYANEYHFGGFWTNPESFTYTTKKAHCYTKPIKIDKDQRWMLRAVRIIPKNADGLAVAIGSSLSTESRQMPCLASTDSTANQVACILPRNASNLKGCISIAPLPYQDRRFDSISGPEPNRNTINKLHLWDSRGFEDSQAAAQSFWAYEKDGTWWFFCDAGGHAIDANNGQSNGADVQTHSNGQCDSEWDNLAHQWLIEDAVLEMTGSDKLIPLTEADDGSYVEIADPAKVSSPHDDADVRTGSTTEGIAYSVDWIEHDNPEDVECYADYVRLEGSCTMGDSGHFIRNECVGQRADACIGSVCASLLSFQVSPVGSRLSGSVEYRVKRKGQAIFDSWCSAGETAGDGSTLISAIEVRLTGKLAEKYDIRYWVNEADAVANGQTAETGTSYEVCYLVARLFPKGIWPGKNVSRNSAYAPSLRHNTNVAGGGGASLPSSPLTLAA